ncbi:MAG: NYN domain-containing protein [Dongiaceae bacterium]
MAAETRSARLAVLIDADNASSRIAVRLFEEIAEIGEASVRRIYGDFSGHRLKGWADILSKHAIIPHQQFAYTTGKNASDIALVIDAMDLLHSGRFDGFCLVSSDSDFTRLAARIREEGLDVFGFGEHKTPESFRQACRRFIYTENLLMGAPVLQPDAAPVIAKPLQSPGSATSILSKIVSQMDGEDGWVALGAVGRRLDNLAPDFDPRTYGFRKLSDLVRKTDMFEIDQSSEGRSIRIRLKRDGGNQKPAIRKSPEQKSSDQQTPDQKSGDQKSAAPRAAPKRPARARQGA